MDSTLNQEANEQLTDAQLFSDATAPEPVEQTVTDPKPQVEGDKPLDTAGGQPRDEQGRFAQKDQAPKADAAPTQQQPGQEQGKSDEAQVPSWRVRELREQREAAERRAAEIERNYVAQQRQLQEMQAHLRQLTEKPQPAPDMFENPSGFVGHEVKQATDPLRAELEQERKRNSETIEYFSQAFAEQAHGVEAVGAAKSALEQAMRNGDHAAWAMVQNARQSRDPYRIIMAWHQQQTALAKIGNDPDKWFDSRLDELAKDPAFQAKMLERFRGTAPPTNPQGRPNINLPPSLNKIAAAQSRVNADGDGDLSDESLFRHATAR